MVVAEKTKQTKNAHTNGRTYWFLTPRSFFLLKVTDVLPNSPASLSKILPNDYLISWDIFDINSLPPKFTLDDVLVSLNDVDRTEGIIVEVGRRRGGTSDNWKNITSTHVFIEAGR